MYEKPGIRVDVWAEIQLNAFTSARVGEFLESTCRAGSGRGLHYRVSAHSSLDHRWRTLLAKLNLIGRYLYCL